MMNGTYNDIGQMDPGIRPAMEQEDKALEKRQRRQYSNIGFIGAAFMLVTLAAEVTLILAVEALDWFLGGSIDFFSTTGLMLLSVIPMYLVAFPVCVALLQLIPKCGQTGRERWSVGAFAACFVISMGIGLAGNILGQVIEYFKPAGGAGAGDMDNMLMNSSLWINTLVTVIMAPVVEELFFRKFLIDRLLGYGEAAAVLVSGLMFGLAHGNFSQFFYAFGIGSLWAYVYVKTGKVRYTIAYHMLFNLIGGVITVELAKGVEGILNDLWQVRFLELIFQFDLTPFVSGVSVILTLGYLVFSLGCLIGAVTLLIVFRRQITFSRGQWPIKKGNVFRTVVLNVGMILYFLVCVGFFIMNWLG